MHIVRQTPQELVVVDGTRWISAICAAAAAFILYFVITRHELQDIFVFALFLAFGLVMDLRKTFTFDAMRRVVRWKGRKVFEAEAGEIPFDDILDIGTQASSASTDSTARQVPTYRLTIVTAQAAIPMSYSYSGRNDRFAPLREQILGFIKANRIFSASAPASG
jgi:hypothetical protein